jgi:hypothetical protein
LNLDSFEIQTAVVHDVPHGGQQDEEPALTDAPINLDTALTGYFRGKIIKSLGRGVEVVVDHDGSPCVRESVTALLEDPGRLVQVSQTLASHLHAVQSGRNSSGLLTVLLGTTDAGPCVSILKLEREEGLRFKIDTDQRGRRTIDLELLRELTLTNKTKVFKTSLLTLTTAGVPISMYGRVSDDQRGRDDGVGVATFFLSTYLGCALKANPEKATLDFVQTSERFFNGGITNPEKRGRYQIGLLALMQNNELDISPAHFGEANLEPVDRANYFEALRGAGIDPNIPFQKDISLVKISGFRMLFQNGMVLVGKREDLEDRVAIHPNSASQDAHVEITDTIKQLSGR